MKVRISEAGRLQMDLLSTVLLSLYQMEESSRKSASSMLLREDPPRGSDKPCIVYMPETARRNFHSSSIFLSHLEFTAGLLAFPPPPPTTILHHHLVGSDPCLAPSTHCPWLSEVKSTMPPISMHCRWFITEHILELSESAIHSTRTITSVSRSELRSSVDETPTTC